MQDKNKYGPYTSIAEYRWASENHSALNGHPTVYCDKPIQGSLSGVYGKNYRFGFFSKTQARKWFSKDERLRLLEEGFKLEPVQGKLLWYSAKQCIFEIEKLRD